MRQERHPPLAAGTRGGLAVLKAGFRAPTGAAAEEDRRAVVQGEPRRVSCFLRVGHEGAFRQGYLDVSVKAAVWRSYWPWRRTERDLKPLPGEVTRPGHGEVAAGLMKQGFLNREGSQWGSGGWVLLCYRSGTCDFDLRVPAIDSGLVELVLGGGATG